MKFTKQLRSNLKKLRLMVFVNPKPELLTISSRKTIKYDRGSFFVLVWKGSCVTLAALDVVDLMSPEAHFLLINHVE